MTNPSSKKEFKYYCEECDFGNFAKGLFNLHMQTKHNITFFQNSH